MTSISELGRYGVWQRFDQASPAAALEIEQIGYTTLWIGASPPPDLDIIEELLEATSTLVLATSIVNIWTSPAAEVAASFHRINARFPGRFLLGVGVGHPELNSPYGRPYQALVAYLDELDAAGVTKDQRALAALRPRVLRLAAERSLGALPYFVPTDHTEAAREIIGPDALLATEQMVVIEDDVERAREIAQPSANMYLGLTNYVANLREHGFTEADVTPPGSDRLLNAIIPFGTPKQVAERVNAQLKAGANHVAVQALNTDYLTALRELAAELND
ncbi:LLM class F420-dependent oxidoreductase [Nocardia camponoti]|uniref:LLM class F420-dependent oxidoreductase n=1 Tax=Nocardia camponoti TaxID=1616106 RepID=A0A917QD30_9NOCA|nr:LLM class F420-dependent oxidoreductase [Nocardia camponoti]GGK44926.1 LLM class F420-dependent oxidoreductase [Nocardia camponoti]